MDIKISKAFGFGFQIASYLGRFQFEAPYTPGREELRLYWLRVEKSTSASWCRVEHMRACPKIGAQATQKTHGLLLNYG